MPPKGKRSAEEPPAEDPPAEDPPAEEPSAEEPPVVELEPLNRRKKYKKSEEDDDCKHNRLRNLVVEKVRALERMIHNVLPGFNASLHPDPGFDQFRSFPLCSISPPYALHISNESPKTTDICHNRTKEYLNYITKMNLIPTHFKKHRKMKHNRKAENYGVYNHKLLDYAEELELRPDPYFSGKYDIYYTRGNVCNLDDGYMAHVTGSNMKNLVVSEFGMNGNVPQLTPTASISTADEIFELSALETVKNMTALAMRRRNTISIHTLKEDRIKDLFQFDSDQVPFISYAQSSRDKHIFLTTDLQQEIKIYDLYSSKAKHQKFNFYPNREKDQNWNAIEYYENDSYLFANLSQFLLWDVRQSQREAEQNFSSFADYLEICGSISCLKKSKFDNLFYIGTTHKLYALDARFLSKTIDHKNIVLRWTHQMLNVPLIVDTMKKDSQELIVLSTPYHGDIRICENFENKTESKESKYSSPCLPYLPPSLECTYNNVKMQGGCLDPDFNLESRVKFSTTGATFTNISNKSFLVTANSLGDVFAHNVDFENSNSDAEVYSEKNMMNRYESEVMKNTPSEKLECTTIEDLAGMAKIMRCAKLDSAMEVKSENSQDVVKNYKHKRLGRWQKPIHVLSRYKDVLAADLLSIWDVEVEDEGKLKFPNSQIPTQPTESLISDWLDKTGATLVESTMVYVPNTTLPEENHLDTSLSMSQKKVKKKSRYVKGF